MNRYRGFLFAATLALAGCKTMEVKKSYSEPLMSGTQHALIAKTYVKGREFKVHTVDETPVFAGLFEENADNIAVLPGMRKIIITYPRGVDVEATIICLKAEAGKKYRIAAAIGNEYSRLYYELNGVWIEELPSGTKVGVSPGDANRDRSLFKKPCA